jgi:hypothetical protein
MGSRRAIVLLMSCLALPVVFLPAVASAQGATVLVPGQGQVFCPTTTLVVGNVAFPAGDCFKLAAYRDAGGTYLAFLPASAPIAPGQVVNIAAAPNPNSPLFLMPISASAALAVNTMALVPARFEMRGAQTRIVLMGGPLASTIVTVAQPAAPIAAATEPPPPAANVIVAGEGQVFCPSASLVAGSVVIPQGDCYRLALLRNINGTFLAFVPQAIALPAAQTIRLSPPAMGAVSGRAYLVPIATTVALPMDTLIMVPARISVSGGQEVITLTGGPMVNTTVRLGRRP